MNTREIINAIKDMLTLGTAPEEALLIKVLGSDYTDLPKDSKLSKSEMLRQLGDRLEKDLMDFPSFMAPPTVVFSYIAAINLKAEKYPSDYEEVIRALTKKVVKESYYQNILEFCIQKREELLSEERVRQFNLPNDTSDLKNTLKNFYSFSEMTLSARLDLAYEIYNKTSMYLDKKNPTLLQVRQESIKFMKTVLNTSSEEKLRTLMADRLSKREINPEYLPNRRSECKKILAFIEESKITDKIDGIKFLTPQQREKHQVIINNGIFVERNEYNTFSVVDTGSRYSHGKDSYASFTINLNGEISLFDYFYGRDKIAHSSMNSRGGLFSAGALRIDEGKLTKLTAYSDRYTPPLQNIYETLKYFQQQGIDISQVESCRMEQFGRHGVEHWYSANEIFVTCENSMDKKEMIDVINDMLTSGKAPEEELLIKVLGKNYTDLPKNSGLSQAEMLRQLGNRLEKGLMVSPMDIFSYIAAINLKSEKSPSDYKEVIRALTKKAVVYHSYQNILTICIQKREKLFSQEKTPTFNLPNGMDDLKNALKKFYSFSEMILSSRLDLAYEIYNKTNIYLDKENPALLQIRQESIKFMKIVLNTNNEKELPTLMEDRLSKSKVNSEYLPNRKPVGLTKLPNSDNAIRKVKYNFTRIATNGLALARKKIVAVTERDKEEDRMGGTIFLTPEKREKYQIIINNGIFVERKDDNTFSAVDTELRRSHETGSYAAFTINLNGEISLFDHFKKRDKIAHSSLNSQAALLAAGELQIVGGKLTALTSYSGHYLPALQNVYETLKYFQQQGIDVSEVQVGMIEEESAENDTQWYSADQIFTKWEKPMRTHSSNDTSAILDSLGTQIKEEEKIDLDSPVSPKPQETKPNEQNANIKEKPFINLPVEPSSPKRPMK